MCDKFFESVGISEDLLFAGGGCVTLIHQVGEKVEGGFLAHFMLSNFFRLYGKEGNARALVILNHHSKPHWLSIGSKLCVNISSLEEKGSLVIFDLLKESYQSLKAKDRCNPLCLKSLFSRCEAVVQDFKKTNSNRVFVLIEDLTNFLDSSPSSSSSFSNTERDVVQFLLKLRALSVTESGTCSIALASLIQSPQLPSDFELTRFAKTVTNALASTTLEVSPLSTGFSAQVTGFLKVICNPRKVDKDERLESAFIRNYHFKLDSNGARATAL